MAATTAALPHPSQDRRLSALSAKLDKSGKGYLTPLEQQLRNYDTNNDGTYSADEVMQIVHNLDGEKKKSGMLTKGIFVIAALAVVFSVAMLGIVLGALELAKEQKVGDSGVLTTKDGAKVVQTDALRSQGSILDLPSLSMSKLRRLDETVVNVAIPKTVASDGVMEVLLKVGSVQRFSADKKVVLVSATDSQQKLVVSGGTATYQDNDVCSGTCEVMMSGRRLLPGRRLLQNFGGALMTSGSFTMMAATGIQ